MKKFYKYSIINFIFLIIFNNLAFAELKFFNQNLGSIINPSQKNMTKINLEANLWDKLNVYGQPKYYFLNKIEEFDDDFNKFNLVTIYLFDDFYESFKKKLKKLTGKNADREFLLRLTAQHKSIFRSFIDCEIKRKATMITIEKKYFNDGYRTSLTPGKLLGSTEEVDLYLDKKIGKPINYPDYKIFSFCKKSDEIPIYSPQDINDKSKLINRFFKKKNDKYAFYLEIKTIKKNLALREIYQRYINGELTETSIKGL